MCTSNLQRMWMVVVVGIASAVGTYGQGPGSCGFHLDIVSVDTSTHSEIADMPMTAVSLFPGGPGNPYQAWTPPGTPFRLSLTVPAGTLGPAPIGIGSPISILWSVGGAMFPMFFPPGGFVVPTCGGGPHYIGVVPVGGAIVDGAGMLAPPPIVPTADPGFPSRFSVTLVYPVFALPPVTFQAVLMTPFGLAISNAVVLMPGANPFEIPLVPGLVPSGPFPALDEGQSLGVPTPPGFAFYGVPTFGCDVDTNGFIDFCPGAGTCGGPDFASLQASAGCVAGAALSRPRINVNHYDIDLAVPPPVPAVPGLTVEFAPADPFTPARTIVRWKNVMPWASLPLSGVNTSFTCELWGDSRIAIVRQSLVGPVGIGPGDAGMGYGGPSGGFDSCAMAGGLPLVGLWGGAPFFAGLSGVIEQDAGALNIALHNLAVVFTPTFPGAYAAMVY